MIDRRALTDRLQRLARAAPGAFRADPVFRYAILGALAALAMLPSRLGGHAQNRPKPPPLPPPAAVGRRHDGPAAAQPAAEPGLGPIAPERAFNGAVVRPDGRAEPDRFGTVGLAPSPPKGPAP